MCNAIVSAIGDDAPCCTPNHSTLCAMKKDVASNINKFKLNGDREEEREREKERE